MACAPPKCAGKPGRCRRPNKYVQYRTLNSQSPYPESDVSRYRSEALAAVRAHRESAASCAVEALLKASRTPPTYSPANKSQWLANRQAYVAHLREKGWVKVPWSVLRLSGRAVQSLRKVTELSERAYEAILGQADSVWNDVRHEIETSGYDASAQRRLKGLFTPKDKTVAQLHGKLRSARNAAARGKVMDRYREYHLRQSVGTRREVLIPTGRRLFQGGESKHPWKWIVRQYLQHPDEEQRESLGLPAGRLPAAKQLSAGVLHAPGRAQTAQSWHRDSGGAICALTVFIPLSDVGNENGPLECVSLSQDRLAMDNNGIVADTDGVGVNRGGTSFTVDSGVIERLTQKSGGIYIVDTRILHRGGRNTAQGIRSVAFMVYSSGIGHDDGEEENDNVSESLYYKVAEKLGFYPHSIQLLPELRMPA